MPGGERQLCGVSSVVVFREGNWQKLGLIWRFTFLKCFSQSVAANSWAEVGPSGDKRACSQIVCTGCSNYNAAPFKTVFVPFRDISITRKTSCFSVFIC